MKFRYVLLAALAAFSTSPVQSQEAACEFGIWYPYQGNDGVPPAAAFLTRNINATFITGDLELADLESIDALFIGRDGVLGNPPGDPAIADIGALINWIDTGGGLVSESNAPIYDSDASRSEPWSSMLSEVLGVSASLGGSDNGISNPTVTVTDAGHPVMAGLPGSFVLSGGHAYKPDAAVDTGKNPSATQIGTVNSAHIIASTYGAGAGVYLPPAVGFGGMDWGANADYETLFLNAAAYACTGGGGIVVASALDGVPVPTMTASRLGLMAALMLAIGLVFVRRNA